MAREARVAGGATLVALWLIDGYATVEIWLSVPWPYLITYHYLPLCMLIAIVVAPYAMWVRPFI